MRLRELLQNEIPSCETVIFVVTSYPEIEASCTAHQCIAVPHSGAENDGIASSIRKGIAAAEQWTARDTQNKSSEQRICDLFFPADQPYMTAELMFDFVRSYLSGGRRIGSFSCDGILRSPNLFDASLRSELKTLTADSGGKKVILAHRKETTVYPVSDASVFADIDTKECLARAVSAGRFPNGGYGNENV